MKHSHSWEANSYSASQEIPRLFVGPEGSFPCSEELVSYSYNELV